MTRCERIFSAVSGARARGHTFACGRSIPLPCRAVVSPPLAIGARASFGLECRVLGAAALKRTEARGRLTWSATAAIRSFVRKGGVRGKEG